MNPSQVADFSEWVIAAAETIVHAGHRIVLLTSPNVRAQARQVLEPHIPGIVVLAYNEIERGVDVESIGLAHMETSSASVDAA